MALALQPLPAYFAAAIVVLFGCWFTPGHARHRPMALYMASLSDKQQAAYAGWQGRSSTPPSSSRSAACLVLAGALEKQFGVFNAWSAIFVLLAVLLALLAGATTPGPAGALNTEHADLTVAGVWDTLREVVADFLQSPAFGWPFCSSCCSGLPKARCKPSARCS